MASTAAVAKAASKALPQSASTLIPAEAAKGDVEHTIPLFE